MESFIGYFLILSVVLGCFVIAKQFEKKYPADQKKVGSILVWRQYTRHFHVSGTLYHDFDVAKKKRLVKENSTYSLKREPDNLHDQSAIAVYINEYKVGYVPRSEAKLIAPQMDRGDIFALYLSEYKPRSEYEALEIEAVNETLKQQLDPYETHFKRVSEL